MRATPDSKSCSTRLDFTILYLHGGARGKIRDTCTGGVREVWERGGEGRGGEDAGLSALDLIS